MENKKTNQEQFEADYLAAFPKGTASLRKVDGNYIEPCVCLMTLVHEQQAKRHEAEIAELVSSLKSATKELTSCKNVIAYAGHFDPDYVRGANEALRDAKATIAKYEVKK